MSFPIFWEGEILFKDGLPAFHLRCCCDGGPPQCCPSEVLPDTLYARICSASCVDKCVALPLNVRASDVVKWTSAAITVECPDETFAEPPHPCEEYEIVVEFACLIEGGFAVWEIRVYCGGTLVDVAIPTQECDPFCATGLVNPGPDPACSFPGVCNEGLQICVSKNDCADGTGPCNPTTCFCT